MSDVLILGPQFRAPNLRGALAAAGVSGALAAVTAGWQEREGELAALEEHLGRRVPDLRLYERAEAVFAQDPELCAAHRARQDELRRMQELYRVRLAHAKAAVREFFAEDDRSAPMRAARRAAVAALRRLDAAHLATSNVCTRASMRSGGPAGVRRSRAKGKTWRARSGRRAR